jgi:ribosomal protein L22
MLSNTKNIKISFLKLEKYLSIIRKQSYFKVIKFLFNFPQKICYIIWNSLHFALNSLSDSNFKRNKAFLIIDECYSTKGKIVKRFQARAKGKAFQIIKRKSNLFIKLAFKSIQIS